MKKEKKPLSKKRKIIDSIILLVCICVFCFSAYNLINIYLDYQKIDSTYNTISDTYTKEDSTVEDDKSYLTIDWTNLVKRNSDIKAWIQIPDTKVNYPVMQGATNDTYIHSDIDKKKLSGGSIFIDSDNKNPFTDLNTVIYGHNMKNGSMFADIKSYVNQDFVNKHPYIYIYLPNGTVSIYKVVSAHIINAYSELYNTSVTDIQDYYTKMLKTSKISVDFDKTQNQPVITLSTCTPEGADATDDRYVVHAVLYQANIDPSNNKRLS